MEVRRGLVYPH
jgi:hypothetical protein